MPATAQVHGQRPMAPDAIVSGAAVRRGGCKMLHGVHRSADSNTTALSCRTWNGPKQGEGGGPQRGPSVAVKYVWEKGSL